MERKEAEVRKLLEENRQLKLQKEKLRRLLEQKVEKHQEWEQIASCFHDTLWKVLLKYEPDTYGVLYPDRKTDGQLGIGELPRLRGRT